MQAKNIFPGKCFRKTYCRWNNSLYCTSKLSPTCERVVINLTIRKHQRTENQYESTITSMCTVTGTHTHTHDPHTHPHTHSNQYNIQVSLWDALKPFRANEPAISVEWACIFWKRLSAIKRKACHMNVTYLRGLVLTDSSHLAVWNNTQDNYWQQAWVGLWPWDNSEKTWKVTAEVKRGNQSFTMKVQMDGKWGAVRAIMHDPIAVSGIVLSFTLQLKVGESNIS